MTCATVPITVCIGTYGDHGHWSALAARAMASVERQTVRPDNVRWFHGTKLHEARNCAAHGEQAEWLCFLDADDELDERYLEAMYATVSGLDEPALVQPATLGVYPDGREDAAAVLIPAKPLFDGNYMVIGTLVRRDQFQRLGGFREWPCYEDWDLWIRCWLDGAKLLSCPNAIYRVHVNEVSRNNCDRAQQIAVYNAIRNAHLAAR